MKKLVNIEELSAVMENLASLFSEGDKIEIIIKSKRDTAFVTNNTNVISTQVDFDGQPLILTQLNYMSFKCNTGSIRVDVEKDGE